ncbi:unnamed protein product [Prorocentrum cordatum]|uniref:Uncharacterized protein n=1 Tax=Prorocentrum cordatum TaxID=2364126 RepID=A0ABN9R7H9_9DINO|nr:unnamed protein product [Polarella glacialis]
MPRRRLRADAVSFSTCITAGHKAGRWDLAAGLLADMRGRRVAPNIITFNASVTALTAGQQWESAVSLLGDMQEVRLQPDLCPYRASVDALFHAGRRVEAARLYRRALQPGIAAYRPAVLWAWHPWRSRSASSSSGGRPSSRGVGGGSGGSERRQCFEGASCRARPTAQVFLAAPVRAAPDAPEREFAWRISLSVLDLAPSFAHPGVPLCFFAARLPFLRPRGAQGASLIPAVAVGGASFETTAGLSAAPTEGMRARPEKGYCRIALAAPESEIVSRVSCH